MGNYIKNLMLLLITKLSHHPIIFSCPWMKKHTVLLNIINNSITFLSKYCTHLEALLISVFIIPTKKTKIISIITYQNTFLNQSLKKSLVVKIDDFLKILEKKIKKKKIVDQYI